MDLKLTSSSHRDGAGAYDPVAAGAFVGDRSHAPNHSALQTAIEQRERDLEMVNRLRIQTLEDLVTQKVRSASLGGKNPQLLPGAQAQPPPRQQKVRRQLIPPSVNGPQQQLQP